MDVKPDHEEPKTPSTPDQEPAVQPTQAAPTADAAVTVQPAPAPAPTPLAPQPLAPSAVAPVTGQVPGPGPEHPEKNYLLALAFSYFLGSLGIDRFYLGYIGTGILKLITFGGFGIWHLIDVLLITFGRLKDKGNPLPLEGYNKYSKSIKPIALVLVILEVVIIVGAIVLIIVTTAISLNAQNANNQSSSTSGSTTTTQLYSN